MKKPELLAPAGNMEKLKYAIHYGADAIYLGGKAFGLRNLADNFTNEELALAVEYAHARNVKTYLTVNSYPGNDRLSKLEDFLGAVADIPFDAYIVADPGVIDLVREISPQRELHLSTQANTINWRSVSFWQKQGINRINLARETTLESITETVAKTAVEAEVFVHGAMCISYSGRCLLSSVMSKRDANNGECSHPCRWNYRLVEESRPDQYYPVFEDENGTFIFNSRDLSLIEHLPLLVQAGVASLKIEGRMKGINYVASVLRVYRQALDEYCADPKNWVCRREWQEELAKLSHRGYTTGFLFGAPQNVGQEYESAYIRSHTFVGVVEEQLADGSFIVAVRNRIQARDEIEIISKGMKLHRHRFDSITVINQKGSPVTTESANPNQRIIAMLPNDVEPCDLLRREEVEK